MTLPIGRIKGETSRIYIAQQAKALAQFQQQVAARVTKYQEKSTRAIIIVTTDAEGKRIREWMKKR